MHFEIQANGAPVAAQPPHIDDWNTALGVALTASTNNPTAEVLVIEHGREDVGVIVARYREGRRLGDPEQIDHSDELRGLS